MHRLDEHIVEEIRARVDIVEVIADYVPLRRAGKNFIGLCPFHQERTPSFTVSPDKQLFYCFGCQTGGDVFTFLMKREGWSFPEAVAELARRAGVVLPERPASPEERRQRDERERLLRVLEWAAAFYRHVLQSPAGEPARAYLASRGVDAVTAERFGLGYAPNRWDALLQAMGRHGIPPALLEQAGLVQRRAGGQGYYDRFRNRVMFPIRDPRGRVVGFGGRALGDDEPKYLNSPETAVFNKRRLWFGLDLARVRLRETGVAVVVEGYMDAIAIDRAGIGYAAVASLGTSLSEEQVDLLARYASTVVIAYDGDAAGQRATLRGLELFALANVEVRVAEFPPGRDPDDVLQAEGPEALRRYIEGAVPLVEFQFRRVLREHDTTSVRGRAAAVAELAPWLARVRSEVERAEYLRRYAAALGVDEATFWREVRRVRRRRASHRARVAGGSGGNNVQEFRHTNRRVRHDEIPPAVGRAERGLLSLWLQYPQWRETIAARVDPDDWQTPAHRFLFELVQAEAETAAAVEPARLVARLQALRDPATEGSGPPPGGPWKVDPDVFDQATAVLAGIAHDPERVEPGEIERILEDYIKTLKRHRLTRIQRRIAELEAAGRQVPVDLVEEFQLLSQQLKGRAGG
ncbi:MAG: DNA primase [Symbiobacteriaceae bacterium]